MRDMGYNSKCSKCGSTKAKEVITGGMVQTVHWDGDLIVREETTYEKTNRHSVFTCDECGAAL